MLQQMVVKLEKEDKDFWNAFAQELDCKDTTELVRKLTVIMKTLPVSEFRSWFYSNLAKANTDETITRLVGVVFDHAVKDGANEIFIEPKAKGLQISYGIGGVREEGFKMPRKYAEPLVGRLKQMAELDAAVPDQAQWGTVRLKEDGKTYEWRFTTRPSPFGEGMTIQATS